MTIHDGRNKWIDCHDNKRGHNFNPYTPCNAFNDQHLHEPNSNRNNNGDRNNPSSTNNNPPPSNTDNNPYNDDYNQEPISKIDEQLVPMTFVSAKQQDKLFHFSKILLDSGGT